MKAAFPEIALARVLGALERELIDASDEEIMEAAKDLGMNPAMRGSAAFMGLKYFAKPQLADFFDLEACKRAQVEAGRTVDAARKKSKRKARQSRRVEVLRDRKDSRDK